MLRCSERIRRTQSQSNAARPNPTTIADMVFRASSPISMIRTRAVSRRALISALVALLGVALIFPVAVIAQQCPNLCGTNNQQITVAECATQTLTSSPFNPCCDAGAGRQNCPDTRKCRSVVFNGITGCEGSGQAELHCIQPAETVFMSIDIATESRPGGCCAECSCSGDPHCYAFDRREDDFILCDGRNANQGCAVGKAVCLSQKDHLGNQCVFHQANGTCLRDPLGSVPTMLFFQSGNTAIRLELGDRGITETVHIQQGGNILSLNAVDCINNPTNPWIGNPIGSLTSSNHGKVWKYSLPNIRSQFTATCIARGTTVRNARLDVSIIDVVGTPGGIPPGVSGFCATGVIDKGQATHDVSDAIRVGNLCANQPNAQTARFFNNGKKPAKLKPFLRKWCNKYVGKVAQTETTGVPACMRDIGVKSIGWAKVFCAANTVVSTDPSHCAGTSSCQICTTDIEDFGWQYAVEKWDKFKESGPKPGGTCLKISELPIDLFECQRGIRIQYLLDGNWVTYRAIPSGFTLCETSGTFNSVDDAVLFQNSIRFTQCGPPVVEPGSCPNEADELCNAEDGFVVTLRTVRETEQPQLAITEAVDDGILVCNPAMYPGNPTGCLNEVLKPCPSCTGPCNPTGFKSPCGNQGCDTCPDPFS